MLGCILKIGALALLLTASAFSQFVNDKIDEGVSSALTRSGHQHNPTEGIIDGAVHPELIPDSEAYRLYFLVVSEPRNAVAEDRNRQLAHLAPLSLKGPEFASPYQCARGFQNSISTNGN